MARGITELDVHGAADALVAKGERPTVERVRAHLGTGSPNTVTRLLETWWQGLGRRLNPESPSAKGAPAVLGKIAGKWWTLALEHARDAVRAEFSDVREDLALKQEELLARSKVLADEKSATQARSEAAIAAERIACARASELQRLVDKLQLQAAELDGQRTAAIQRLEHVEASGQALYDRLQETEESARSERESLAEHVRSVETRALGDLDRARQEGLAKLQNLPADLEAALKRIQVTAGPRKTSSNQRAKKSSSKDTN
ncbi:hypothetical protein D3C87_343670 [compost metagenome]